MANECIFIIFKMFTQKITRISQKGPSKYLWKAPNFNWLKRVKL